MMPSAEDDTWADIAYESAVMLENLDRPDDALQRLQEVLTKDPNHAQALTMRDRLNKSQPSK